MQHRGDPGSTHLRRCGQCGVELIDGVRSACFRRGLLHLLGLIEDLFRGVGQARRLTWRQLRSWASANRLHRTVEAREAGLPSGLQQLAGAADVLVVMAQKVPLRCLPGGKVAVVDVPKQTPWLRPARAAALMFDAIAERAEVPP